MSAESAFSYTVKDSSGNLCTLRGDTFGEFAGNAQEAFGPASDAVLAKFAGAFGATVGAGQSIEQAATVVQAAFPQAVPVSTVGQPLPQPGAAVPQAVPAPAAVNAGPAYPGDCAHGQRVYKSSVSARGQWDRWDCFIPYSKEAAAIRCKSVNC